MRTTSLLATLSLGLLGVQASTAHAGGFGLMSQFATHQERVPYYSPSGEQGHDSQTRPTYGSGLEAIIGDRDDKVQGLLRMSWSADAPAKDLPDDIKKTGVEYPPAHEQDTRHVGTVALGIQWGVLGDPSDMQLVINSLVGSGFITVDNTEYMLIETGVGGTYNFSPELQAVANIDVVARHRKRFTFGPAINLGIRYMFD